jgi:PAS domain S-box-containing protein
MSKSDTFPTNELLGQCEKEPIHIPGAIQSHGLLIVADKHHFGIRYISKNWEDLLEKEAGHCLQLPLSEVLGDQLSLALRELLSDDTNSYYRPTELSYWKHEHGNYLVLFHLRDELLILELEPQQEAPKRASFQWLDRYQNMVDEVSLQEMLEESAREIRRLTGYDRVMMYRFHPDMHGEVQAEEKRSDLESFLGLHYPASDIPRQARQLYLTNWTRLLVDVNYSSVPVLTLESSAQSLDMSHATLRSVSPVHIEYLQNMGVSATLTISIIYQGQLWGLIACHHYRPKFTDFHTRSTCELIGRLLSLYLPQKEQKEINDKVRQKQQHITKILNFIDRENDFVAGLMHQRTMLRLVDHARGAAICYEGQLHLIGDTPRAAQLREFIDWYEEKMPENKIFHTYSLADDYPHAQAFPDYIRGLMLLKVHEQSRVYILWFRGEYQQHIYWAGNPEKAVKTTDGQFRLSPRESFRQFLETVEGQSEPWTAADIELVRQTGEALRDRLLNLQHYHMSDVRVLFQMIYEQSSDAIFMADVESGLIIDCNSTAVHMFEAEDKEALMGTNGLDLHDGGEEERKAHEEFVMDQLSHQQEASVDVLYKSLKGRRFWGRFNAKFLQRFMRKVYIVRVADISESKHYEVQLERHNKELKKVNRELDRFVYSASHDLRAPIASLMGLLEVARDMKDVEEILTYLDLGRKSLERLDHFIQEILDYSRNSRMELKSEAIDFRQLIEGVMENYAYIDEFAGIDRQVEVSGSTTLYSDPFRLKVVLNNLISNALRYNNAQQEQPYVKISAKINEQEAVITVSDNGRGIPEPHLDKIFEMFYRADSQKSGSGLGLYIVKETLDKLKGSVSVNSAFTRGTTFRIVLPNGGPA